MVSFDLADLLASGVPHRCSGLACCSESELGQVTATALRRMKIARGGNLADVVERWLSYSSHFSTPDGYLSTCPWPAPVYGPDRLRAGAQRIVPVDRP